MESDFDKKGPFWKNFQGERRPWAGGPVGQFATGENFDRCMCYSINAQLPLLHPTAEAMEFNPVKSTINNFNEMLGRLEPSKILAMTEW